jgi:hypothetical protein
MADFRVIPEYFAFVMAFIYRTGEQRDGQI